MLAVFPPPSWTDSCPVASKSFWGGCRSTSPNDIEKEIMFYMKAFSHAAICSLTGSSTARKENKWNVSKLFLSKSELKLWRRHLLYYIFFQEVCTKVSYISGKHLEENNSDEIAFLLHVSFPKLSFIWVFQWCNGWERSVGTNISDFIWMSRRRRRHYWYSVSFGFVPWKIALLSSQKFCNLTVILTETRVSDESCRGCCSNTCRLPPSRCHLLHHWTSTDIFWLKFSCGANSSGIVRMLD